MMTRRRIVGVVVGVLLLALPVVAYGAYDYVYVREWWLVYHYPWLSDLGRYLRRIAAAGVVFEIIAWAALVRYVCGASRPAR